MKYTIGATAALLLSSAPLLAGGIERAPQSLGILFEPGNYVELGFGGVNPTVRGRDEAGVPTGDVAQGYGFFNLGYKHQFNDNLSAALIIEQPFGADLLYPVGVSPVLGGTRVEVNSTTYTGLLRYKFENNFSVHGGIRASRPDGGVTLDGEGYSVTRGYDLELDKAWGFGYVVGAAYEIPEIAARVSLTYNSPIEHDFDMTESGPIIGAITGGLTDTVSGDYEVRTPRSWTLEGQTGIAPDTLLFGSVRWVKWSEFKVDNFLFPIPTGTGEIPLVELEDTTTYTIGVGRKFTENWSGAVSFHYEASEDGLISPLAPTDGRKGVSLAAIYTMDSLKVTTGVSYVKLGDADLGVGESGNKRYVGTTDDNDAIGVGIKVGYSF